MVASKQFKDGCFVRIDKGEEIVWVLKEVCEKHKIKCARVQGIGAIGSATFGFFNPKTKEYQQKTFEKPMEITSLIGNVTLKDGKTYLHLHLSAADENYEVMGGHLVSAVVSATAEIILKTINTSIEREFSEDVGLNILKIASKTKD